MHRFARGSTPSKRWTRTATFAPTVDGEELAIHVITLLQQRLALLQGLLSPADGANSTVSSPIGNVQASQSSTTIPSSITTSRAYAAILRLAQVSRGDIPVETLSRKERKALNMICRLLYDVAYNPALPCTSMHSEANDSVDASYSLLALLNSDTHDGTHNDTAQSSPTSHLPNRSSTRLAGKN